MKEKVTWDNIILSYIDNPRDVKTNPIKKEGIWFYVYVENEDIYLENAKKHLCSSKIKGRRKLDKKKLDLMLMLNHERKNGAKVSQLAEKITRNQVYWYGIFADIGI